MNKTSSKEEMEEPLNLFENIKKVKAPEELYMKIESRVKQQHVSWSLATAGAAVFTCLIISEIYLIQTTSDANKLATLELVLPQNNNLLYNE